MNRYQLIVWLMRGLMLLLACESWVHAAESAIGAPYPVAAANVEGIWRINLAASGLPGYGKSAPKLTPWGEQQRAAHQRSRSADEVAFDLTAHCSSPGIPRVLTLPYPMQLLARADNVTQVFAWNHLSRRIAVDAHHYVAPYPAAMGAANGRWQDGRLMIETRGRNGKTLLDDAIPNTEVLVVQETLSVSADGKRLTDEIVITDPMVLVEPWHRTFVYERQPLAAMNDNDVCLDRVAAKQLAVPKSF